MKISDHPIIFYKVKKRILGSSWISHSPFAFFLISILKPRTFVELGVFVGQSYHAFCQAVKTLDLDTQCYGIDTWQGDEHVSFYDNKVFTEMNSYNEKEYPSFSHLLRMSFDEGLKEFDDGSIDLLHIDGFHTYDAVKKDFETWLPKMSDRGVVLFHDSFIKDSDFGVWKFWEEVSQLYPSFEFYHGCGLGIAAVGKNVNSEFLEFISEANNDSIYRKLFSILGMRVIEKEIDDDKTQQLSYLDKLKSENKLLINENKRLTRYGKRLNHNLNSILESKEYLISKKIHNAVDRVIPHDSIRRSILVSPVKITFNTVKKIKGLKQSKNKPVPLVKEKAVAKSEIKLQSENASLHENSFFRKYYRESLESINNMPVPESGSNKRKCAIFVMVKDEKIFLPIWLKYYSGAFDGEDIYVFDHMTSDNSIEECKKKYNFNVIRLDYPFSFDHEWFRFVANNTQKKLLESYEYVIFTDVDEILLPLKEKYSGLRDFIDKMKSDTVQAKGYDLIAVENKEEDFNPAKTVLSQRKYWYETFWYNKTLISKHPLDWNIGFHIVKNAVNKVDHDLLLIHLHKLDFKTCWKKTFERARLWWLHSEVIKNSGWQNRITDIDEFREYYYCWPDELKITEIPDYVLKTDAF